VVYVDETDEKAIDTALFRASRAYEGFLAPAKPGETFEERVARLCQDVHRPRRAGRVRDHGNVFNPDYLLKHDLVFIGSPETVAAKIRAAAASRRVQHLHGRVQFLRPAGADLLRSIRLFGEKVIPALRGYEPF
jgi:alkanesulfonate monooxygenase SsuD/methylene tetrahydromethanopterin reductase-like flavin-dependent oxidoreductase (luciferase family)